MAANCIGTPLAAPAVTLLAKLGLGMSLGSDLLAYGFGAVMTIPEYMAKWTNYAVRKLTGYEMAKHLQEMDAFDTLNTVILALPETESGYRSATIAAGGAIIRGTPSAAVKATVYMAEECQLAFDKLILTTDEADQRRDNDL